ncbi:MAG: flagellar hook-associated protein FlgK [Betaproteobacteria bacterium TMED156]|nr:MAG: flagellar hook-associated protein FlgK [Betaproteobacteria bacterium TMED156]
MSDINSIAAGAVSNYQKALATVANNIANVDSEGYSRQEVDLSENTPTKFGTSFFGTGARLDGVKRLYDGFIENSLRNSKSDLSQQGPMVDYASRVINILGSETVGLTSALDQFFNSARELSIDPSSLIRRTVFMSDSENLTSRFKDISSQLDLIVDETKEAINSDIIKLNVFAEQLSLVNNELAASRILTRQPLQLLDERDQILREMSEVAKITVKEAPNGSVDVSLSSNFSGGVIVSGLEFEKLVATFDDSDISKVNLQLGQYKKSVETVSGIGGGSLGGLLSFRKSLLEPTFRELDGLAKTFVSEINQVHNAGLDLNGNKGIDLFRIDPELTAIHSELNSNVRITPTIVDPLEINANDLEFQFDAEAGQVSNLTLDGQYRKGDVVELTLNGSTIKYTIPFLGIEDVGEKVSLEEVRDGLFQFLDANYGQSLRLSKESDRQVNIKSEEFGFFSLSPVTLSSEGLISVTTQRGLWEATDKATNQKVVGVDSININGLNISFEGSPIDGEILNLRSENRPAAGINVAFENPALIAAAGDFRIIDDEENPSGVNAKVDIDSDFEIKDSNINLDNVLTNQNFSELEAIFKEYDQATLPPVAIIPAGFQDIQLIISPTNIEKPVDLQVLTRDANHLNGNKFGDKEIAIQEEKIGRKLTEIEQIPIRERAGREFVESAFDADVGLNSGSTYSNNYFNIFGPDSYRDMDIFYGLKAEPEALPQLGLDHVVDSGKFVLGSVVSEPINRSSIGEGFSEESFVLNGKPLTELKIDSNHTMEASDIRRWLKPQADEFGIKVEASSEIKVDSAQIIPSSGLKINGTTVVAEDTVLKSSETDAIAAELRTRSDSIREIRDAINLQTNVTGVAAYMDTDGNLVLGNQTGKNIDISGVSAANILGVTAKEYFGELELTRVIDQVRVFAGEMDFSEGLTINNVIVGTSGSFTDIDDVRDKINELAKTDYRLNQITAYLDTSGALVIGTSDTDGIVLAGKNVLNLEPGTYSRDLEQAKTTIDGFPSDIRLGFGNRGNPADMKRLGFDTSLYLKGNAPEDMLIFADGDGPFSLAATYNNTSVDQIELLRQNPFEINFISDTRYQIIDKSTQTKMAERDYNVSVGVKYQNLKIELSGPPKSGDKFTVDGNSDGIGNNQNIIAISEIEKKRLVGAESGLTFSESYDGIVTDIGNYAQRASVSQEALTVIYDESVAKRDQVSGVSLDQEAADLVRYQQAYQASAKVMQTAGLLFDAIIGIR